MVQVRKDCSLADGACSPLESHDNIYDVFSAVVQRRAEDKAKVRATGPALRHFLQQNHKTLVSYSECLSIHPKQIVAKVFIRRRSFALLTGIDV